MMARPRPLVALIGRTNVGKSTLWNRFTETGHALVSDVPHTTRDRRYGTVLWHGKVFDVVDTGGMDTEKNFVGENILLQARHAIREADLILFVVDAKTGILPQDQELAKEVKKSKKATWLVANKVDGLHLLPNAQEAPMFHLGFKMAHPVSAASSFGIGDLLDEILINLEENKTPAVEYTEPAALKIAVIGRPNVGKSSIVNAILGEERVIVSPIPHTTREPQDTFLTYKDQKIQLIDTAGIRRKTRAMNKMEEAGVERNEEAIHRADIAVLVFDVSEEPTAQDRALAGIMEESQKGLILVANKWDLIDEKTAQSVTKWETGIRQSFPFLQWTPIIFTSATKKQRTREILDKALEVEAERHRHIDYNAINRLLKVCIKAKKPLASYGPKSPRIYDVAQTSDAPPKFLITVHGDKDNVHPNWIKFFEKRIREKFGFLGTPIVVKAQHLPVAKSEHKRNVNGPGMEAVAGKIREKPRLVNQTRRRQKHGRTRY